MLTGGGVGREGGPAERGFAPGAFEEYDLDPAVRRRLTSPFAFVLPPMNSPTTAVTVGRGVWK
jgi:hypothetical protein